MSFAFMPLYTGDYIRDTSHLSPREHGVYLLMLAWCWQSKKHLPGDLDRIHRVVNARDEKDEQAVKYVLEQFWQKDEAGDYFNQRLERELLRSDELVKRAKAGAEARWKRAKGHAKSDAKSMLNGSQNDAKTMHPNPITITTTTTTKPNKGAHAERACRLPDDWILPKGWGDWALKEQPSWNEEHVRKVATMFRNHWTSISGARAAKRNWFRTWQNWVLKESALKGAAARRPWYLLASEIEAKGRALGKNPPPDKSGWAAFRDSVYEAAGVTPEMVESAKRDFT